MEAMHTVYSDDDIHTFDAVQKPPSLDVANMRFHLSSRVRLVRVRQSMKRTSSHWFRVWLLAVLICGNLPLTANLRAAEYMFSHLAGTSENGFADGLGAQARFRIVSGLAVAPDGTVFVADLNNTIRKITPDGLVTTIAGADGESGTTDGVGAQARFNWPSGLALNDNGDLYIADQQNCRIRLISSLGVVSTIAGGSLGANDGVGSAAQFYWPLGLTYGGNATLFVTDVFNHEIRRVMLSGEVTTLAGSWTEAGHIDGAGSAARFDSPTGVARDSSGNLYVTDQLTETIRRITPDGSVTTYAGKARTSGASDGPRTDARFSHPLGIAVDTADTLYVVDRTNLTIRQITRDGMVTTLAGSPGVAGNSDGSGLEARFTSPTYIAVDLDGNLYVSDGSKVRKGTRKKVDPGLSWVQPPAINEGEALSSVQLNASANVAGTFSYSPGLGAALGAGMHTIRATFTPADRLSYSIVSAQISLQVMPAKTARLVNISTRAFCATGDQVTIGGIVISGTQPRRTLIRAVGPSLASKGIKSSDLLTDPLIEVHDAKRGNAVIASNDDWTENANAGEIASLGVKVGASPLDADDTRSSALLLDLNPGIYTFVVSGKAASSGIVLIEAYDADLENVGSTFVNTSTRAYCESGDKVAIGGFVVAGNKPKQVLLRAVGPTLTAYGVTAALADPTIELHDASHGNVVIATNDNWTTNSNAESISRNAARVGAMPLGQNDTSSSALLLSLDPGVYTFLVNGRNGGSGIVLVEIYDADYRVNTSSPSAMQIAPYIELPADGTHIVSARAR